MLRVEYANSKENEASFLQINVENTQEIKEWIIAALLLVVIFTGISKEGKKGKSILKICQWKSGLYSSTWRRDKIYSEAQIYFE